MNFLQLLAADKEILLYRKELNKITKKVTATILLQQIIYWNSKMGGPFFKFIEPSKNNPAYREGDSWCEELGFSIKEFGTAYRTLEGLGIVSKKTNMNRVTWYALDLKVLGKLLNGIYGVAETEVTETPKGGLDINFALTETTAETTQILEEEEAGCEVEIVSTFTIPSQLHGLIEEEVVRAIQELVRRKRPNDPSSYEARLLAQVESGDRRTCQNVLKILSERDQPATREKPWDRDRRLEREDGEAKHLAMKKCGFNNPGEAYAALRREGVQDDI